jgi:hypothetical protein
VFVLHHLSDLITDYFTSPSRMLVEVPADVCVQCNRRAALLNEGPRRLFFLGERTHGCRPLRGYGGNKNGRLLILPLLDISLRWRFYQMIKGRTVVRSSFLRGHACMSGKRALCSVSAASPNVLRRFLCGLGVAGRFSHYDACTRIINDVSHYAAACYHSVHEELCSPFLAQPTHARHAYFASAFRTRR